MDNIKKIEGRDLNVWELGYNPKNVVGHIYSTSKEHYPIAPNILNLSLAKHRNCTKFVGFIKETEKRKEFQAVMYPEPIIVCQNAWNITKRLPSYKIKQGKKGTIVHMTSERDYVKYVSLKRFRKTKTHKKEVLSLKEFLRLTRQSRSDFEESESIKYTGM